MSTKRRRIRAGLLGATGAVGQMYVRMLAGHPFIQLDVLMGGESAGKLYGEAVHWLLPDPIPEGLMGERVLEARPESAGGCDIVFSALPTEVARELEPRFAEAGFVVVSEASAHRMEPDVPLVVPEVNADHLRLLEAQRERRGWRGAIVTTPNCTATGLALVLKPLLDRFGAEKVIVTTMQAVSGAGFPGLSSLLILENLIPYIRDEEEKVRRELGKILGRLGGGGVLPSGIPLGISCNRVPVLDGHMATLYLESRREIPVEEAIRVLEGFRGRPQRLGLPTAPTQPIIVRREEDRPQPRLDRMAGSVPGMSVVVGRVRRGIDEKSLQLTLLHHNTIRGAAGTAILAVELMEREGYLG